MASIEAIPSHWDALPPPQREGRYSIEELLAGRRSLRTFSPLPVSRAELGQLLWAAQGVTDPRGFRTTPSAGALYPLEVYAVDECGVRRYLPSVHALLRVTTDDRRRLLARAAHDQESIGSAPLILGVTGRFARMHDRYGPLAERYTAMEAGHAVQNLLLQASALDLGAVPIASLLEEPTRALLAASAEEVPLYLVPVGRDDLG